MEKSYVGMTQYVCPVTGQTWQGNEILIDKRLRKTLNTYNTVGYKVCPEVQEHIDKGFIPLVVCDPEKSKINGNRTKPEDAYRTGDVCYLKREAFYRIFNVEQFPQPFCYIDPATRDYLQELKDKVEK